MESLILKFTLSELLSLFGLAQCLYVLVYIAFRSGRVSRAVLPVLFFAFLGGAFLLNAAQTGWQGFITHYEIWRWGLWTLCAPLSALLVVQIARITKLPPPGMMILPVLVPAALGIAVVLDTIYGEFNLWLQITGLVVGAVSMLVIWRERECLGDIRHHINGKERFWLVITLVVLNTALLALILLALNQIVSEQESELIRTIVGISFVYIASTSLFRLFPQAMAVVPKGEKKEGYLSDADVEIALKIENLLHLEKVYQEPSYGRSNLAQELGVTDSNLSKIVNIYFHKTVPQLLNTYRVEEAKVLLKQTAADIATISEESGFNSVATFNRVFKEIAGMSPSDFRIKK